jgi:hypothetical protein
MKRVYLFLWGVLIIKVTPLYFKRGDTMSYIAPQGDIYILKNVPFDRSYNHTVKWGSATTQFNTLSSAPFFKYHLEEQSYQRWKRDYIRVSLTCDDLYNCNYLIFRNKGYSNKWFYAFLDEPEYINNNCSEIHYTIDVMQTWMFDIEVPPCFVEREHTLSDGIGDNLVPENLEHGELEIVDHGYKRFERFLGAIVTTKRIPDIFTTGTGLLPVECRYTVRTQYIPDPILGTSNFSSACGIPTGLYVAYGFPVDVDDISFWEDNRINYDMQDYRVNGGASLSGVLTLGRLLSLISKGLVQTPNQGYMSGDDIVAAYIYPSEFNYLTYMSNSVTNGNRRGTAEQAFFIGARPTAFQDIGDSVTYYPKNNKLFTYPYVQLMISNNRGNIVNLKYEEANGMTENGIFTPLFRWVGTWMNPPQLTLVPSYNNLSDNYEQGLSITDFPVPTFMTEQYAKWLEQNGNRFTFGLMSSVIGTIANTAMSAGAPMPPQLARRATPTHHAEYSNADIPMAYNRTANAISSGLNLASEIGSSVAKIQDLKNAPPSVAQNVANDLINVGTNRVGFRFYSMAIKKQFATIIDDYFSMFGYATKRVKVPNVFSSNTTHRRNWNYLNTKGALVKSASDTSGVPAFDLEQIQNILDKGITFWNFIGQVGNYNLDNSIVTQ